MKKKVKELSINKVTITSLNLESIQAGLNNNTLPIVYQTRCNCPPETYTIKGNTCKCA